MLNYTLNGQPLIPTTIEPEHLSPDTYSFLEAPRIIKDTKHENWDKYYSIYLFQGTYREWWN